MKKDGAYSTAQNAATRFGTPYLVYRMPGFPPDEYGVIAEERGLPSTATIDERFTPLDHYIGVDKGHDERPRELAGQGSLF